MLRSVGATRAQMLGLIAFEAALVGALGVVLGTGLGYWAARANVDAVSATLTQVYLLNEITTLQVPPWVYLAGAAAGMGAALAGTPAPCPGPLPLPSQVAALLPSPAAKGAHVGDSLALAGTGILALAAVWYQFAADWRPAGFVLGIALLVAIPLFTPLLVRAASLLPLSGLGVGYGFRSLAGRWTTTVFTASSLAIAVSMMVGVTLKTSSFRKTLEVWLQTSVQADIYVKTESWRGRGDETALSPALVSELVRSEDVVAFDRYRRLTVQSGSERIFLAGVETGLPGGEARFPLTGGDPDAVYRQFREEGAALVGETLARRRGLEPGERLPLVTPTGDAQVPIAGIYYDYQPGTGLAVVGLETMEKLFGPGPVHSAALYLRPGADTGQTIDRLKAEHAGDSLLFRSNRKLRQEVMEIFDQTFAVTRLLQGTSLLIAVAGIILTLLVLAREESAELALYRSLGARRSQLFRIFVGKGLGMGVTGLALGLGGGVILAAILVFVINRAYFGVDHPGPLALGNRPGPSGDHPGGGGAGEPVSGAGGQPNPRDSAQPRGSLAEMPFYTGALVLLLLLGEALDWKPARPDYAWSFPQDHWARTGYRTEWWYFTGHLETREEVPRRFGYQFTFFRVGLQPSPPPLDSTWTARDVIMGHAAVTDLKGKRHLFSEILYRAMPLLGEFGDGSGSLIAWSRAPAGSSGRWSLHWNGEGFDLAASDESQDFSFRLTTHGTMGPIFQGPNGYSIKGGADGAASQYYSFTRMATRGRVSVGSDELEVRASPGWTRSSAPNSWEPVRWDGTGSVYNWRTAAI